MIIKAGTYRWNDDVLLEGVSFFVNIPYTVKGIVSLDTENQTATMLEGTMIFESIAVNYSSDGIGYVNTTTETGINCYSTKDKWNDVYVLLSLMEFSVDDNLKGYGQIITITEDTDVADDFGLWATSNWQPYSESTPVVEITYKGEKIELSAGQTATLHIKDHKLTEDLVIKANATSGGSYEEYNGEVVIE